MSIAFRADESVQKGARRIAGKQLQRVVEDLGGKRRVSQGKTVHEGRKRLKKLRSLLRLLRAGLGEKAFREFNAVFREAGRSFSSVRDATVVLATFDELIKHFHKRATSNSLKSIRSDLLKRRRELLQDRSHSKDRKRVIQCLKQSARSVNHWKLKHDGWAALRNGLEQTYRAGRKAFADAENDPCDGKLHERRKRAKDLYHQFELLGEMWPLEMDVMTKEAHQLADWLGDDHDLAMLRQALGHEDSKAIETLITARRKELQTEAFVLGSRIYSQKPADFVRQMHGYWKAWKQPAIEEKC